jgi:hypothetical protein
MSNRAPRGKWLLCQERGITRKSEKSEHGLIGIDRCGKEGGEVAYSRRGM